MSDTGEGNVERLVRFGNKDCEVEVELAVPLVGEVALELRELPVAGDVAWMLVCTALVLMMSVPALALFYGGMVRAKNTLSVLMQVFVVFSLVTVLWCVYGYSLAFTEGNPYFGGFDRLFLKGAADPFKGEYAMAATFSKNTPIPELVFIAFQATFAAITCCLIVGAFAERAKFAAVLVFIVLWFTFAYLPVAHMVWFWAGPDAYTDAKVAETLGAKAGLLWDMGALDFAGGTVVHINAGIAGLVGAYCVGKRIGYGKEAMPAHNLPLTMIGAALLWTGWFGFNAGSALEANNAAALAFLNTFLATACAVLSWSLGEAVFKGKPTMLGAASGAVAGLVAITPAAGNVGIAGAFVIGTAAGLVCLWGVSGLKKLLGADDSLDREAPILSLDTGLAFERTAGSRNQFVQTLEPRLRYTWIPFRDQDDLPVFDSALPDLNLVQLFRTNRYVGADRLGDANEVAAGLTTRLVRAESGQQYLTATIGQRFYFESPEVVLPGEVPESRNSSNMVGEIDLTAWRDWSARVAMEYDRSESNTLLGQASVQYRPRPDSVVNLGYRYREAQLEQYDASVAWRTVFRISSACSAPWSAKKAARTSPARSKAVLVTRSLAG